MSRKITTSVSAIVRVSEVSIRLFVSLFVSVFFSPCLHQLYLLLSTYLYLSLYLSQTHYSDLGLTPLNQIKRLCVGQVHGATLRKIYSPQTYYLACSTHPWPLITQLSGAANNTLTHSITLLTPLSIWLPLYTHQ